MSNFLKAPILIAGLAFGACGLTSPKAAPTMDSTAIELKQPAQVIPDKKEADEPLPLSVLGAPEAEVAKIVREKLELLGYTKLGLQKDGSAVECEIGSDRNMTMQMSIVNAVTTLNGGIAIPHDKSIPTTDSKLSDRKSVV